MKNLLLFLPFFKPAFPPFSLFPGEVLPYFLLHFRPKVNNETVFISFILLSLFSFIYLIYQPSMTWVIDFFEVFFIIIFVLNFKEFFPLKFFKSNIRIFSVLFFILGIIDFYVFNNFLTSYISEAPSSDVLSDFNRGASFFAPEPSYLGIFSAGMAFFCLRNKYILEFYLFSICLLLTISLWAYGLYFLTLFFILNIRFKILYLSILSVVLICFIFGFFELPQRLNSAVNFLISAFQRESIFNFINILLELESTITTLGDGYGGRLHQIFGPYILNVNMFPSADYLQSYSFLGQIISLFGFIFGFFIFILFIILFFSTSKQYNINSLLIILVLSFFWGPVPLITSYFLLFNLRET